MTSRSVDQTNYLAVIWLSWKAEIYVVLCGTVNRSAGLPHLRNPQSTLHHTLTTPTKTHATCIVQMRLDRRPCQAQNGYVSKTFSIINRGSKTCSLETRNSSGDEMANVNFLRRHRTCRGQRLHPLNRLPNF